MHIIEFNSETLLSNNPSFEFSENTVSMLGEISQDADSTADKVLKGYTAGANPGEYTPITAVFAKPVREAGMFINSGPNGTIIVGYDENGEIAFAEQVAESNTQATISYSAETSGLTRVEIYDDAKTMVDSMEPGSLLEGAVDLVNGLVDGLLGGLLGGGSSYIAVDLTVILPIASSDASVTVSYPSVSGGGIGLPAFDSISFDQSFASYHDGTAADEMISGTDGEDLIDGAGGDDVIDGGNGDDVIRGGAGTDSINGGAGDDILDAGAGSEGMVQHLNGGDGDDTFIYSKEGLDVRVGGETAISGTADTILFTDMDRNDVRLGFSDAPSGNQSLQFIWDDPDAGASGTLDVALEGQHIETYEFANGDTVAGAADFFDFTAFKETTETGSFGNGFAGSTAPHGVVAARLGGLSNEVVVRFDGFDIDTDTEVELFLNGDSLGHIDAGTDNGLETYEIVIGEESYNLADNVLEFRQAADASSDWGVTNIAVDTRLRLDTGIVNGSEIGNRFESATDADGVGTANFTGTGTDMMLSFDGFDIDTDTEVELFVNGNSYGFLDAGVNQSLEGYDFKIAAEDQVLGDNVIEFHQATDPAFSWGITDVLVKDIDFKLTTGVTETGAFGNRFNGVTDADGVVTALFTGAGTDLLFSFDSFDIDKSAEVELFVNGNSRGFLGAGVDDGLEAYSIMVAAEDQSLGDNVIEFHQATDTAFAWGVTDVLVEEFSVDFDLTTGIAETGAFGNEFVGTVDTDGVIAASFTGTGTNMMLSFDAFDIDKDTELELLVNGKSYGFMDAGVNQKLKEYEIEITAEDQFLGDNVVEFRQGIDTAYTWGITDVLVENLGFDFTLTTGEAEAGAFGNKFEGATDADGVVAASFTGTGSDLVFSFDGFDIDTDTEVELFVNGDSFGFLDAGVNQGLKDYEIQIAAEDQFVGENVIEFHQAINPAYTWGITDLLIEDAVIL